MNLNPWKKEEKSVPPVNAINELTRDGIPKAFIPEFLYKPPYGYPRYSDLPTIRQLAKSPYVEMCIETIVSEITGLDWDIVAEDEEKPTNDAEVEHVRSFFKNPNANDESFVEILKKVLRDILEIDGGVINKVFNKKGQMVEIYAKDGATFTKNPDMFGRYSERADLILTSVFDGKQHFTEKFMRDKAAYFQYGWVTGAVPVPFGRKELVWFEQRPRSDSLYGRGPIEVLLDSLKILVYAIENNLEYYNNNSIPKGIIGLEGSDLEQLKSFKKQWEEQQITKDSFGGWKKLMHKIPIVNKKPEFVRIGFSNQELEMIAQQEWFSKMVWACFGVTPSELGYTEDSNKATELGQSHVFRRKAINPLVRLLEYRINHQIVSEFEYENIAFKFDTFDIAEEFKKSELYEKQVNNGLRTVNEIRKVEGYDPVEWGDEPPKYWQSGSMGDYSGNPGTFPQEVGGSEDKSLELKFKYMKRTGSPGNYTYWYKNPKTGKLEAGDEPKEEPKKESEDFFKGEGDYIGKEAKNKLSHERFDLSKAKILSAAGSDRSVYELPDGKVIKIVKTMRGLAQSYIENNVASPLIPKIYEQGKDYAIFDKMEMDKTKSKEMLKGIQEFTPGDFYHAHQDYKYSNKKNELKTKLDTMASKYNQEGFKSVLEHDIIAEDFKNPDNWGWKGDKPYLVDGGTLDAGAFQDKDWIKDNFSARWNEIRKERIKAEDNGDTVIKKSAYPKEKMDETELSKELRGLLDRNKKILDDFLEREVGNNTLSQVKSADDIISRIKEFLSLSAIKSLSDKVIQDQFYKGWEMAEKQLGRNFVPNESAVRYLKDHTFDNIKDMSDEVANDLRAELQRGIINGEGLNKLKDRVKSVFDKADNRAEAIARTEVNRAENVGTLQAMKASGEKMTKTWDATLDNRTSEICNRLDGQTKGLNEPFVDPTTGKEYMSPPSHVNCRSVLTYSMEEKDGE